MKRLLLTLAFVANMMLQAQTKQTTTDAKYPVIKFEQADFDFGTLHEGEEAIHVFKFKNIGDVPLIIHDINAGCGCTVVSDWKKKPIMPGENGEFTVLFDTMNYSGGVQKNITIYCNTKNKIENVSFKADVIPDPEMEKIREEELKNMMKQQDIQKSEEQTNDKISK